MSGSFEVALSTRQQPGAEWQESQRSSKIEPLMRGGMLQESYTTPEGTEFLRTFSYDKFNETYRITQIDNRRNQLTCSRATSTTTASSSSPTSRPERAGVET